MLFKKETVPPESSLVLMKALSSLAIATRKPAENAPKKVSSKLSPCCIPDLEKEVAVWIIKKCKAVTGILTTVIFLKARSVGQKLGLEKFKAS